MDRNIFFVLSKEMIITSDYDKILLEDVFIKYLIFLDNNLITVANDWVRNLLYDRESFVSSKIKSKDINGNEIETERSEASKEAERILWNDKTFIRRSNNEKR